MRRATAAQAECKWSDTMRLAVSLTPRGQALVACAGALALGAFLSGAIELYGLAGAALVLVVVAWTRARHASWDVAFTRTVTPSRIPVGTSCRVDLAAHNIGSKGTPRAEGRDPYGDTGRTARFSVASIKPGEIRSTSYSVTPSSRGLYRLGPLSIRVSDPFGLAEAVGRAAGEASLRVHPRFEVLPDLTVPTGGRSFRKPTRRMGDSEPDSFLLRRYSLGDDLRRVHWPTTARIGELTLRQNEPRQAGFVVIVADLRRGIVAPYEPDRHSSGAGAEGSASREEPLETLLETAATLAASWLRAGVDVRFLTSGGFDSGRATGRGHLAAILDALADASPHDSARSGPVASTHGDTPIVVVTTDRCTQQLLRDLLGQRATASVTVVKVAAGGGESREGGPGRHTPIGAEAIGIEVRPVDDTLGRQIHIPPGSSLGKQIRGSAVKA